MAVTYSVLMLHIDHLIAFESLMFTGLRDVSLLQNHQWKRGIFKLKPQLDFFKTCVGTYPLLDKYNLFQMLLHILKSFSRAV